MRIAADQRGEELELRIRPEPGDFDSVPLAARGWYGGPRRSGRRGTMRLVRRQVSFRLPSEARIDDLQPDVLALACAFLVLPFVDTRLTVPRPVSASFAETFRDVTGIATGPLDGTLAPNTPRGRTRAGLAFSGGADSTAAAVVLPPDAALVHLHRARTSILQWRGYQPWSSIRQEAGLRACKELVDRGRDVHIVPSDLEYLTSPLGRPTIQAIAVPLLLLSASLGLDAVSVGPPLETVYGLGHGRFTEPGEMWERLNRLYAAAGLLYVPAAIGLPEVATTRIVVEAGLASAVSSCVRGSIEPCGRCVKCLRKGLVLTMLSHRPVSDGAIEALFRSATVIRELTARPIHHENVYDWLCSRYVGSSRRMAALRKVVSGGDDVTWNERSFGPGSERLPGPYAHVVAAQTGRYIEPMSETEVERVRSWRARSGEPDSLPSSRELYDVLVGDRRWRAWMALRAGLSAAWRRARRIG